MKSLRREGVEADYGTLTRYKKYVEDRSYMCLLDLTLAAITATTASEKARAEALQAQYDDWRLDLDWVKAELAKDAV